MAKQQAGNPTSPQRARKAGKAFEPTRAQRAFVAAAAGLGVPRGIICEMLPGARPGETVPITRDVLRREFEMELRDGLDLAVALVEARVFQRALSQDDRSALAAQMAILNSRAGWKAASGQPLADPPPQQGTRLEVERLTHEERALLRKLVDKATPEPDRAAVTGVPAVPLRRHSLR